MAKYIPFIYTKRDLEIFKDIYSEAELIRVSLESIDKIRTRISQYKLWIDPAIDSYHVIMTTKWPSDKTNWKDSQKAVWENWHSIFGQFSSYDILKEPEKWVKQNYNALCSFIYSLLDACCEYHPNWITVPQLPIVDDGSRNKINKYLSEITRDWKSHRSVKCELVFPLIFTKQTQINNKTTRNDKVKKALENFKLAGSDHLFIVDQTISDSSRNSQFHKRYEKLIDLHKEIRKIFPEGTNVIAGPYWGINLVLWARDLCQYPAISMGAGYQYYYSCDFKQSGNIYVALPAIRRKVILGNELKVWLSEILNNPGNKSLPFYNEAKNIVEKYNVYIANKKSAVKQTAEFYKSWLDIIERTPQKGRALALFQDLTTAYANGQKLGSLPNGSLPNCTKAILQSGKVAEQLMLHCLGSD